MKIDKKTGYLTITRAEMAANPKLMAVIKKAHDNLRLAHDNLRLAHDNLRLSQGFHGNPAMMDEPGVEDSYPDEQNPVALNHDESLQGDLNDMGPGVNGGEDSGSFMGDLEAIFQKHHKELTPELRARLESEDQASELEQVHNPEAGGEAALGTDSEASPLGEFGLDSQPGEPGMVSGDGFGDNAGLGSAPFSGDNVSGEMGSGGRGFGGGGGIGGRSRNSEFGSGVDMSNQTNDRFPNKPYRALSRGKLTRMGNHGDFIDNLVKTLTHDNKLTEDK